MPGFLTRNWRLKLLALVLAIFSWAGVVLATNPPGTRAVSLPVPQPSSPDVSLPAGYLLTEVIPNLTVDISGTENHLNAFSRSSLQVTVDYDAIRAVGQNVPAAVRLPITITNTDPNIELDDPPTSVEAHVDSSGSASEPVQVVVSHAPPAGYQNNPGVATPATVTATGPEHELVGIVIRTKPIDLSNQRANFGGTGILLYPYSAQGRYLSDVNLNPATVNVAVTVVGLDTTRTSSVVLGAITGTAAGALISVDHLQPHDGDAHRLAGHHQRGLAGDRDHGRHRRRRPDRDGDLQGAHRDPDRDQRQHRHGDGDDHPVPDPHPDPGSPHPPRAPAG